jgi:hypothetical protein
MGIFYTSSKPVLPEVHNTILDALRTNLANPNDAEPQAAKRTLDLVKKTDPSFNAWRFAAAVTIACGLLLGAIWTGQHNLADISKELMTSFSGFSGLVLGLLGGEAQKSSTG